MWRSVAESTIAAVSAKAAWTDFGNVALANEVARSASSGERRVSLSPWRCRMAGLLPTAASVARTSVSKPFAETAEDRSILAWPPTETGRIRSMKALPTCSTTLVSGPSGPSM